MKTKQLYKPIKLLRPLRNISWLLYFSLGKDSLFLYASPHLGVFTGANDLSVKPDEMHGKGGKGVFDLR